MIRYDARRHSLALRGAALGLVQAVWLPRTGMATALTLATVSFALDTACKNNPTLALPVAVTAVQSKLENPIPRVRERSP